MIEQYIDREKYDFEVIYTQYAGHAYELAKKAAEQGVDIVVAVGGDGTINEIITSDVLILTFLSLWV